MEEESKNAIRSRIVELALEVAALADLIGDLSMGCAAVGIARDAGWSIGFSGPVIELMRLSVTDDVGNRTTILLRPRGGDSKKHSKRRTVNVRRA